MLYSIASNMLISYYATNDNKNYDVPSVSMQPTSVCAQCHYASLSSQCHYTSSVIMQTSKRNNALSAVAVVVAVVVASAAVVAASAFVVVVTAQCSRCYSCCCCCFTAVVAAAVVVVAVATVLFRLLLLLFVFFTAVFSFPACVPVMKAALGSVVYCCRTLFTAVGRCLLLLDVVYCCWTPCAQRGVGKAGVAVGVERVGLGWRWG